MERAGTVAGLALDVSGFAQAFAECPRGSRSPEQRDEFAALHSITSSARASSVGGTSRPRARAVLRLITSWNRVGRSAGSSAALQDLASHGSNLPEKTLNIRPIAEQSALSCDLGE